MDIRSTPQQTARNMTLDKDDTRLSCGSSVGSLSNLEGEKSHASGVVHRGQPFADGVLDQFSQSRNLKLDHEMRAVVIHGLFTQFQGGCDLLGGFPLGNQLQNF